MSNVIDPQGESPPDESSSAAPPSSPLPKHPQTDNTNALVGLFAPPTEATASSFLLDSNQPQQQEQELSNSHRTVHVDEAAPLLRSACSNTPEKQAYLFSPPLSNNEDQQKVSFPPRSIKQTKSPTVSTASSSSGKCHSFLFPILKSLGQRSTWIGSVIFLLYHIVFCLAQASAIPPPTGSSTAIMGVLAQMAALGVICCGPVMVWQTSPQIPAVYPASDLFLAPFLAHMAADVNEVLQQRQEQGLLLTNSSKNDNKDPAHQMDDVFLATFGALFVSAMALSGLWCVAAARIRLANLGHFLPYPVLAGFFTTIGILMWTLGFSVDTGGITIGQVVQSGDWQHVIAPALLHHAPSLLIGLAMHLTNPFHPSMVIGWIFVTILGSYTVMGFLGVTLETAQENNWFYSLDQLVDSSPNQNSSSFYGPPRPGGIWVSILEGNVCWPAYVSGIQNLLALTVLYLIRCSLHAAALKKNIPNVTRVKPEDEDGLSSLAKVVKDGNSGQSETFLVPLESKLPSGTVYTVLDKDHAKKAKIAAASDKKRKLELGYILEHGYAYSQFMSALVGGIAVSPATAASVTLFQLGAEEAPPQFGSCLLLIVVYLTDFRIVQYIPKPAFSSLMVLAGFDMCRAWLVRSYQETKSKGEWMVAPVLVVLAFWLGLLNAIFIGIAISTFWFAASFHRAGTVKFVGSGISLRSTTERGFDQATWLDQNADLIQILVLQNYLFFGNVQSVSNYVTTMFEEYVAAPSDGKSDTDENEFAYIPPLPQHLILDFTFVTGMDTSAIDLFREITSLCKQNDCKLYLAGMTSDLRSMLVHAKVTNASSVLSGDGQSLPTTSTRKDPLFYVDLEAALAKAEDALMSRVFHLELRDQEEIKIRQHERVISSSSAHGFLYALDHILAQHGDKVSEAVNHLRSLASFTNLVELEKGQVLPEEKGGLFFVETGLMRVRQARGSATNTLTGTHTNTFSGWNTPTASLNGPTGCRSNGNTLTGWNARSLGRHQAFLRQQNESREERGPQLLMSNVDPFLKDHPTFRLARIGHGWVTGSLPLATPVSISAVHVAVSPCRLHHMPHDVLVELEKTHPDSMMHLYKLVAYLSAKRQEMTILHLNQFVRIMQAPTPRLRKGKMDLGRIHASSWLY